MNSRRLYEFLELFNLKKKFKKGNSAGPESAQGCEGVTWPSGQIGQCDRAHAAHAWWPTAAQASRFSNSGDMRMSINRMTR
jgi:hypothetical protein